LPKNVPLGIKKEFREAERCLEAKCFRAAAGLFRSVLEKTLKDNGYTSRDSLFSKIESAHKDGVITKVRMEKAQNEIRVLGNDVLHDEWMEIEVGSVLESRHYCQRILEDLYDERSTVELILKKAKRLKEL